MMTTTEQLGGDSEDDGGAEEGDHECSDHKDGDVMMTLFPVQAKFMTEVMPARWLFIV